MPFAVFFCSHPLVNMVKRNLGEVRNMTSTQRKPAAAKKYAVTRPEFTAAVRYMDGSRDIFHVRNADNLADARSVVLAELDQVKSLLIAIRH
jgi:monomeric isocitrate dehydrogenase